MSDSTAFTVIIVVFLLAMAGSLSVSSVAKSNCKVAAIQAHASELAIEACNRE